MPTKRSQPQKHVIATEQPPGKQTGNEPEPFLSCSNKCPTDIQISEEHTTTTLTGDTTISPLIKTTSLIQEVLVKDERTNDLPLTSTVVLKPKQEMLYVPLDFENNPTVDTLLDSRAYVSSIAQNKLDTIKQKGPKKLLKMDEPPDFQIQVANGELEEPLATATFKFEIGDNVFAEHFVAITGPIKSLHFLRKNSVVNDKTHVLILFPRMTMQVKTASSETTAKPQSVITDNALTIPPRQRQQKQSQRLLTILQSEIQQGL